MGLIAIFVFAGITEWRALNALLTEDPARFDAWIVGACVGSLGACLFVAAVGNPFAPTISLREQRPQSRKPRSSLQPARTRRLRG